MEYDLTLMESEEDIALCFDAFKALRPHLSLHAFVKQVVRQVSCAYKIVAVKQNGVVLSAAGFRVTEFLAWGKVLYVDDLTTLPLHRGKGCAAALLDWMINYAKVNGCDALHLDTGHHRHAAHKLYLKKGLSITSHHLSLELL